MARRRARALRPAAQDQRRLGRHRGLRHGAHGPQARRLHAGARPLRHPRGRDRRRGDGGRHHGLQGPLLRHLGRVRRARRRALGPPHPAGHAGIVRLHPLHRGRGDGGAGRPRVDHRLGPRRRGPHGGARGAAPVPAVPDGRLRPAPRRHDADAAAGDLRLPRAVGPVALPPSPLPHESSPLPTGGAGPPTNPPLSPTGGEGRGEGHPDDPRARAARRGHDLRRPQGALRLRPGAPAGRAGRAHRPERRRQDDRLQRHHRRLRADAGRRPGRRRAGQRPAAAPDSARVESPAPSRTSGSSASSPRSTTSGSPATRGRRAASSTPSS